LKKRIYIGSDAIISPLGFDTDENFRMVLAGVTKLTSTEKPFRGSPFCVSLFDEQNLDECFSLIGKPASYTRLEKISILAIDRVLKQSRIDLSSSRTLLIYSSTKGNINLLENESSEIPADRVYLPLLAHELGRFFKCAHEPLVVSNACISGVLALIIAARLIRAGQYDHIVVSGGDIISEFTLSGFQSFAALSPEPCRPYDAARKGINLGEAAAAVLVTADSGLAGKERVFMAGGASANDANHISGPSRTGEGLFQALRAAMEEAGLSRADFISAHGTATEFNDEMESIAFSRAGLSSVPMHSLKGYFGHTLGAAGLVESILSIQSLRKGKLIASAGFENKGVSGDVQIIALAKEMEMHSCIKTASGFGGCNAAAIFIREEGGSNV
jgi:3-oxoacyl-[acyl-carrier-protein] synthase-1